MSTRVENTNNSVSTPNITRGNIPRNASPEYLSRYLRLHGLDSTVANFLNNLPAGADESPYYTALLDWAETRRGGIDNLMTLLRQCKNLSLTRQAYERYGDRAEYRQRLDTYLKELGQSDYFGSSGATDRNRDGAISADEPGYDQRLDVNRDRQIDVSEILADQGALDSATAFMARVEPQRRLLFGQSVQSIDLGREGASYRSTLELVANSDSPAEVKAAARWLIADYDAQAAVSRGDFAGALEIYEGYAAATGQEPGGLYPLLRDNQQHFEFLSEYYTYVQANGHSNSGLQGYLGGMNGVEFLVSTVSTGALLNAKAEPAKSYLAQGGITAETRDLFWQPARRYQTTELSSTQLGPASAFTFTMNQQPIDIQINDIDVYNPVANDPAQYGMVRYDLATRTWNISIQAADVFAVPNAGTASVVVSGGSLGEETTVAELSMQYAEGTEASRPATREEWYQDNVFPALQAGQPVAWNFVVAPDNDQQVSLQNLEDGVTTGLLTQRFLGHPEFVLDPTTERGARIIADLRARKDDPEATEQYVMANLTGPERLRYIRLGDQFIGGGMSAMQYLAQEGFTYTQADIEYPANSADGLLRIKATRYIPLSELSGPMRAYFDQHPELRAQYPNGVPLQMTVEIYSTTANADLAAGRHLAAGENTAFQTHAYKSDLNNLNDSAAGTFNGTQERTTAAFVRGGCHAGMFAGSDTAQFGGDLYYAPMIDAPYTGIAHFLIPAREIIALTTGNDPKRAADRAYEQVGADGQWGRNDPAKVITDDADAQRLGTAVPRFGAGSVAATLQLGRHVTYSPVDGAVALVSNSDPHDRILIRPNNPLYQYFMANGLDRTGTAPAATTEIAVGQTPGIPEITARASTPNINIQI